MRASASAFHVRVTFRSKTRNPSLNVHVVPDHELMTFNVGLFRDGLVDRHDRLFSVIRAIQRSTADVLCLNEAWYEHDIRAVRSNSCLVVGYFPIFFLSL